MLYTLQNDKLQIKISDKGAEMQSVLTPDGTEYLWQGDPTYWKDRALNIFPYVAMLTDKTYEWNGKKYQMEEHGFAPSSLFRLKKQEEGYLELRLTDDEETYRQYPFHFSFDVCYRLCGERLTVTYLVENKGGETMYFGLGGHPGFRLPLTEDTSFEDYYLEFSTACRPYRVGFTESFFVNGKDELYPLEDHTKIRLRHNLFDHDAVVLRNMAKEVTLRSDKNDKAITVSYPQMGYLGLWHTNRTDAPFLCIEPWSSLPSRDGIVENLACQSDLIALPEKETYKNSWSITIKEKT